MAEVLITDDPADLDGAPATDHAASPDPSNTVPAGPRDRSNPMDPMEQVDPVRWEAPVHPTGTDASIDPDPLHKVDPVKQEDPVHPTRTDAPIDPDPLPKVDPIKQEAPVHLTGTVVQIDPDPATNLSQNGDPTVCQLACAPDPPLPTGLPPETGLLVVVMNGQLARGPSACFWCDSSDHHVNECPNLNAVAVTEPKEDIAYDPTAGLPPETPNPPLSMHLPAAALAIIHDALVVPAAYLDFY